jgi:para-nitrobenzyl esterase
VVDRRNFVLGGVVTAVATATGGRTIDRPPVVRIRDGLVRGRVSESVFAFTGIPFAEPPVGLLRFRPPGRAKPWSGELDATHPANAPPQDLDPALPQTAPMSEDCLQLNIWTPRTPGPHPVFVWIYGGGNASGSISLPPYQGETFARDGIVFVSCNYRVGALGFLELGEITGPEDEGSGNNALRDLILGLEWVRDNIAAFGGDAQNVTVGGQSAGAFNCASLMALPAASGLFHRAILASGGADVINTLDSATEFARHFVARLGGKQRLRSVPVADLLRAQKEAQADSSSSMPFRPVVDGKFLPGIPIELLRRGSARSITTMVGHTHDESRYLYTPAQAASPATRKRLLHLPQAKLPSVIEAYQRAFPGEMTDDIMLRILSADLLAIPSLRIAEAQASSGAMTYYYDMRYAVPGGPFGRYSAHGIDVPLIFELIDTGFARTTFGYTSADFPMAIRVHATWVSFMKTGLPGNQLPDWAPYDLNRRYTMTIAADSRVISDPDKAERDIWEGVM